ncbi:queuosine precursor transporter [Salinarimonas soli]|uniref:Probable queuosine precursor transporter n=1 Tax=Salinarimonas soli TaxID=1638099 RepID=A0A5B2VDG0_9HYPH|nr:queuosine precursor transporter [Salinarimonas soli]KAA2237101.1 queuosine precursor transporter [Salinarimonas soli]
MKSRDTLVAVGAMALVVLASNILVQYPVAGLGDYLTWGAFSYPVAFLVTDLSNRRFGPAGARRVVYAGFVAAVALSIAFATPRIALASGAAFLSAQLLDIAIFQRLRHRAWWMPPFVSSVVSSALDTGIFFSLAFYCGPVGGTTISGALAAAGIADTCQALPWVSLALADYAVKLALAALAIAPYGALLRVTRPAGLR